MIIEVEAHRLDMRTGIEYPCVEAQVDVVDGRINTVTLIDGTELSCEALDSAVNPGTWSSAIYVALAFDPHPDHTRAFSQMMSHAYSGPVVVPRVVAIGRSLNDMFWLSPNLNEGFIGVEG